MLSHSLVSLADELLTDARAAHTGRSARTIHGGRDHTLRQTLLAFAAGKRTGKHESPGEATLQVLRGKVALSTEDGVWEGTEGEYLVLPAQQHDLEAVEDAVVLLTTAVTTHSEA